MASINISEEDFYTIAHAAQEAQDNGHHGEAAKLDKLARKVNAALSNAAASRSRRLFGSATPSLSWEDVPSAIILK